MPEPTVSIIIPTFNRSKFIEKAVDSALAQTVKCEIIVCDHGSTDNTYNVLEKYGNKIKYIKRDNDNGPIFSWLDGVINSNSEYVHLNFDDDWIHPYFIEKCMKIMREDCAFVFSSVQVYEEDKLKFKLFTNLFSTGRHKKLLIENILLNSDLTISPGCAIFRKKDVLNSLYISKIPFADTQYRGAGPDLLMFLLPLLSNNYFGFVNEELVCFNYHENSITIKAQGNKDKLTELVNCYTDVKKYYIISKLIEKYKIQNIVYRVFIFQNNLKNRIVYLLSRIRKYI